MSDHLRLKIWGAPSAKGDPSEDKGANAKNNLLNPENYTTSLLRM